MARPLTTYTVCLNVEFRAADREQALAMAVAMKQALEQGTPSPYKAQVEIDDLEEL